MPTLALRFNQSPRTMSPFRGTLPLIKNLLCIGARPPLVALRDSSSSAPGHGFNLFIPKMSRYFLPSCAGKFTISGLQNKTLHRHLPELVPKNMVAPKIRSGAVSSRLAAFMHSERFKHFRSAAEANRSTPLARRRSGQTDGTIRSCPNSRPELGCPVICRTRSPFLRSYGISLAGGWRTGTHTAQMVSNCKL